MICEVHVHAFCNGDITKIENYDKAIADNTQTWHCHHRLEIHEDYINSSEDLKLMNLYYNRPPEELIFLTNVEHRKIHSKGNRNPMYNKGYKLLGEKNGRFGKGYLVEGERNGMYNKHHSEEARRKMSESRKGKYKGRKLSEEARAKIAAAAKLRWNSEWGEKERQRRCIK